MTGKIKLVHSGGNAVSIAVPTSNPSSSEVEFKLPGSDGSANQVLKTDGSGNLSFGADQGGKILQVAQTTASGDVSSTSASDIVASGHICSVTPVATGSKFLVTAENISGHFNLNTASNSGALYYIYVSVNSGTYANVTTSNLKNVYAVGNIGNWINVPISFNFLASPSYSSGQTVAFQTYFKRGPSSSGTFYYNHAGHSDMNNQVRTLTVIEVAA